MNCKDCKYWNSDMAGGELDKPVLGRCEWFKDEKAFVQDGSDYRTARFTMPDYGCVQFEVKDD